MCDITVAYWLAADVVSNKRNIRHMLSCDTSHSIMFGHHHHHHHHHYHHRFVLSLNQISLLSEIHPIIWKFINGLRRYQKLKDGEIEGLIVTRIRPAYECLNRRIKNIVLDYENRDIIDYLRGQAHNIMH